MNNAAVFALAYGGALVSVAAGHYGGAWGAAFAIGVVWLGGLAVAVLVRAINGVAAAAERKRW